MPGHNRFGRPNEALALHKSASIYRPCVFISHRKTDKIVARKIMNFLHTMELDTYFDQNDTRLQTVHAAGNEEAVASCIEDGLNHCTHLLGIISVNTAGSWWVPYEIGSARGRKKPIAHLMLRGVDSYPEFIKLGRVLIDQYDLEKWTIDLSRTTKLGSMVLSKSIASPGPRLSSDLESIRIGFRYY